MTDNEITREKTFSEELPYFKERIKEVFDNYDNPNGYEDPLYIAVLRDSHRIVRKAEEEINRQQTEIEKFRKTEIEIDDFCRRLCHMRMLNGNAIASYEDLQNYIQEAKSGAIKEFANKLKNKIKTECNPYGKPTLDYDTSIAIMRYIDNLVKEMIGENNARDII